MRVVIDTNCLESEELRIFLEADETNVAVIPEHTTAEVFKPSSISSVLASMAILIDFPDQVILLHGNRRAAMTNARAPGIANRLVDRATMREFPNFCAALKATEAGNRTALHQLEQRQRWARERSDTIQLAFGDQSDALSEIREQFTEQELRSLRTNKSVLPSARDRILALTTEVARRLSAQHPGKPALPQAPQRYYHFTWRYALCHIVQLLRLIGDGAIRRAPEKARNDHFDNVFATFGTYFNGIMSDDAGALSTHAIARAILTGLGVRLAPDYIESGYIISVLDALEQSQGGAIIPR